MNKEKKISKGITYDVRFEERTDYLYVFIHGEEDDLDEDIRVWTNIAKQCKNRGFQKLIVEDDLGTELSITEMYSFVTELPKLGFTEIRFAYVDQNLDYQACNEFGETVGQNRGITGKIFTNINDAEKWLLSTE